MKTRNFKEDFLYLLEKLKNNEPFAFTRFSDGELDILQNLRLVLEEGHVQVGNQHISKSYNKVDHKDFNPEIPEHQVFRTSLYDAFRFRKFNYFKGLSCKCCVGEQNFNWMINEHGEGDDEHLTWANLLVNGNYPLFAELMSPEFEKHKLVMVCHKDADLSNFPYPIEKEFRVGYNAFINDLNVIDEMMQYINAYNINEHVFLFSASTFSALAIHKLYAYSANNTYINIGTTMNNFMGMPIDRIYLKGYWNKIPNTTLTKTCIW